MPVFNPTSLDEALRVLSTETTSGSNSGSRPLMLAGGTDLMVQVNEQHRHLDADTTVVALGAIPDLTTWRVDPAAGRVRLGAGLTWTQLLRPPLAGLVPALTEAARTVGSPQIRNAGTIGGNLATCSPAGDGLPVLAALDAVVHLRSLDGVRLMPVSEFMVGVKRTALAPGELIEAIELPLYKGWQGYSKVGVRNAMVIATASACLAVDPTSSSPVRLALGSVAPTIVRSTEAEAYANATIDWGDAAGLAALLENGHLRRDVGDEFARLAPVSCSPIDDHRSTAAYRRHAVGVMARRLLERAVTAGAQGTVGGQV